MNSKLLIAAAVGGIVAFVLGFVCYALLFADFFASNTGSVTGYMKDPEEINMAIIFVGNLSIGLLLAIIFGSWANIKTFAEGAKAGAIFGLLIAIGFDLIMYATTNAMNLAATLVDPIIGGVMMGITGGVVAMMLGRGETAAEG